MAFRNKWKLSPTFISRNNVLQQGYINHKVVAEDRGLPIALGSLSLMEIALFEINMPLLAPLFKASLPSFPFLNDFDKLFSTPLNLAFSLAAIFAHLAATELTLPPLSNLADVVNLFLGQAQLDNSTKDVEDRTCLEACKTSEEDDDSSLIKFHTKTNGMNAYKPLPNDSDNNLTESLDLNPSDEDLRDSHSALSGNLNNHKQAVDQLCRFILRPRSKFIDLNLKEEQSGTTDINLIKLAINRGADVLAKDCKNKMPSDVTTNERVKNLAMKTMSVQKTNWNFENGSLNGTLPFPTTGNHNSGSGAGPNDEGKTVRGLIAMSVATVVGPDVTKDRLRFKVSSKLGNSFPRFYLKVAHPLEVMRWVDALKQVIECANYNANKLQPLISPSINTPTSRLLSASGMSNNKRERLGFVNRHLRNTRAFLSSSGGSSSTTDCNNSLASANTVTTTEGFNRDPNSPHGSDSCWWPGARVTRTRIEDSY
ncbi:hypothetical protein BY996DRAFT_6615634 [Phakopsora pachyrhizi]|nr:hypothetical protein BY996DRAFT_6615634 [Phakopsora pachyrhizi]